SHIDFSGLDSTFQDRYTSSPKEAVLDLFDLQVSASEFDLIGSGWNPYSLLRNWIADAATNLDFYSSARSALLSAITAGLADFGYPGLRINGDGTNANEAVIGSNNGATLNGA